MNSQERSYSSIRNDNMKKNDTSSSSSSSLFSPFTSNFLMSPFQQQNTNTTANTNTPIIMSHPLSTQSSSRPPINTSTNPNNANSIKNTITREQALQEASNVTSTQSYQNAQFENFNLSSVVMMTPNLQQQQHQQQSSSTTRSSENTIIGGMDLSSFSLFSDSSANLFNSVSESLSKEITLLNSTINSYSRTYLNGGSGGSSSSIHGNDYINCDNSSGSSSGGGISQMLNNLSLLDYEQQLLFNDILSSTTGGGSGYSSTYNTTTNSETKIRSIEDLPKELTNMDLTQVESYLRKCGLLAYQFDKYCKQQQEQELQQQQQQEQDDIQTITKKDNRLNQEFEDEHNVNDELSHNDNDNIENFTNNDEEEEEEEEDTIQHPIDEDDVAISMVPEIFFSPYFDLTDPKTFESLLVLNDDDAGIDEDEIEQDNNTKSTSNNLPTLNLPKPEKLSQYLDIIELSLLNQVRSKSNSFFRETNRFSYLKSLVADLVDEVKTLRESLDVIKQRSVTEVELIPILDRRRRDIRVLGRVLDEIGHVLDVKSSVVGLIGSGDYLGAVEAIHKARSLLNGDVVMEVSDDDDGIGYGANQRFCLGKIVALNKVSDQLAQYENLVVSNACTIGSLGTLTFFYSFLSHTILIFVISTS